MNVPFLFLKAQYKGIKDEIAPALLDILDKCCFINGPYVSGFEKEMEDYLKAKHVAGCSSGTEALVLLRGGIAHMQVDTMGVDGNLVREMPMRHVIIDSQPVLPFDPP